MRCHGNPDHAPKSQLATYGRENGYGWKLQEIVAAQIVLVPANQVIDAAKKLQFLVIGIISIFFLMAMAGLNVFLRQSIIQPLKRMAKLSKQVSTGNMEGEFQHNAKDEIGTLAASLNRMKISLQMAIHLLNQE